MLPFHFDDYDERQKKERVKQKSAEDKEKLENLLYFCHKWINMCPLNRL